MKFSLISFVLLLVPLAFAKPPALPTITHLFFDGHHLTEGYDIREIRYLYQFEDVFIFRSKDNVSAKINAMDLDSVWMDDEGAGFAIDSYVRGPDFPENDDFCKKNSDKDLKERIDYCRGNIVLRMLTNEERAKTQQYKIEQQASNKPFEVIYDRKKTTIKSTQSVRFYYDDRMEDSENHALHCETKLGFGAKENQEIRIVDRLVGRSFTIEGLPASSEEECGKIGLPGLNLTECVGKIRVRPNRAVTRRSSLH